MEKSHKKYSPRLAMPKLIVVSKTFPSEEIVPVLELGHRAFGENRVQEALGKWVELKQKFTNVELHLIGPLQTNKVVDALKIFDVIHTVDREKLARVLASQMEKSGKNLEVFVQVNIGEEPQKSGVLPHQTEAFVKQCKEEFGLNVVGLMCIPPLEAAPGPYFALLNMLAKQVGVQQLSMGMSSDFETGIEMGATHVRVGTAIFGAR